MCMYFFDTLCMYLQNTSAETNIWVLPTHLTSLSPGYVLVTQHHIRQSHGHWARTTQSVGVCDEPFSPQNT